METSLSAYHDLPCKVDIHHLVGTTFWVENTSFETENRVRWNSTHMAPRGQERSPSYMGGRHDVLARFHGARLNAILIGLSSAA